MSAGILQFAPFASAVESTFWHSLASKKLDTFKLNDGATVIQGYHEHGRSIESSQGAVVELPANLCIGMSALDSTDVASIPHLGLPVTGSLRNTNTIEDFRKLDKTACLHSEAEKIWHAIESGEALQNPSILSHFMLLTFADLKKYKFYFWFGFPALVMDPPCQIAGNQNRMEALTDKWSYEEVKQLHISFLAHRSSAMHSGIANFFLIRRDASNNDGGSIQLSPISNFDTFFTNVPEEQRILGFADPSSLPNNPGWPLRNFLMLAARQWHIRRIQVVCLRDDGISRANQHIGSMGSRWVTVDIPPQVAGSGREFPMPKVVGWERNAQGKLGPRLADLAPLMDPLRLAETAVDLNLKLMRWRVMPKLDLEKVQTTKCLLLGAGTLGCYVARSLVGWGIRNITFVDNARVSFSNPVRQPLFNFEDCLEGGKAKAETAAESLKRIYPGLNTKGYSISIPMPGHTPTTTDEETQKTIAQLRDLIKEHDVTFLLMDSRESRWLPTVIATAENKLVMNAALSFDTYLVMRHGAGGAASLQEGGMRLGCYFCNDIVAPADSLTDRTLDQQCTVTRPGLSAIASAMLVELMVSLVHHPLGSQAPADVNKSSIEGNADEATTPLGILPHQIRGFLSHFSNMLFAGHAYDKCTACSEPILQAYQEQGYTFLKRCFSEPDYLEEVSGLAAMKVESEEVIEGIDWVEESEGSDDF